MSGPLAWRCGPLFAALGLLLPACGGGQGSPPDAAPDIHVDTDDPPDAPPPDAPHGDAAPDVPAPDDIAPGDVPAPDAAPDPTAPFPIDCDDDADCLRPCAAGVCEAGVCAFPAASADRSGCVVPAPDAGDGLFRCVPPGAPGAGACSLCEPRQQLMGYTNILFSEDFDAGGGQFTIEKKAFSSATWSIDTGRASSGTHSFYFGDPDRRTYDVGARAAADAVTRPLVDLPGDDTPRVLTFHLYADTEETPAFDTLQVLTRAPDDSELLLWSSDEIGGTTVGGFDRVRLLLPPLEPGTRLVFRADSIDEIINDFEGFYIDDVRVLRACCAEAADCDDADICTTDSCEAGACVYEEAEGCCGGARDCDDGDRCTADLCALGAGACTHVELDGCCRADADCDDGEACTRDRCGEAGACENVQLCCDADRDCDDGDLCTIGRCDGGLCRYSNSCCTSNDECGDGDTCTDDVCLEGICRNDFNYGAGCCLPDILTEGFEPGGAAGWTLSPATNNIGWRLLTSATAPTGSRILYYGHPTLLFYESGGRNQGSATSPPFRLPRGVQVTASLSVRLDIEAEPSRDRFTVEAVVGDRVVPLVEKGALQLGAWQELRLDLSWAAGQTVQLRLRFDTVDGVQNTGRGVSVDDVQVFSDCQPRLCDDTVDCPSRLDCLTPSCEAGACVYRGACD